MRVLMQNRHPGLWIGGDQVQLEALQGALTAVGTAVDFSAQVEPDLEEYDLVHLFNLPAPWTYLQCVNAQRQGKPVVISTIYQVRHDTVPYSAQQWLASYARKLIFASGGEVTRARRRLAFLEEQVAVVPNGVDQSFRGDGVEPFEFRGGEDYVLCVGRINDKNQLRLAAVCRELGVPVVLVGELRHPRYQTALQEIGHPKCVHLGPMTKPELIPIYKGAKVVACVSPAEVYPSVVLEGGLAGCNVVLTKGSASMKDWPNVELCDPNDPNSIAAAIDKQMARPRDRALVDKLSRHTWVQATRGVKAVYDQILSEHVAADASGHFASALEVFHGFSESQREKCLQLAFLRPAWSYLHLGSCSAARQVLASYARLPIDGSYLSTVFLRSVGREARSPQHSLEGIRSRVSFIERVFGNLPTSLSHLSRRKSQLLGALYAEAAFETHAASPSPLTALNGCRALVHDLSWLGNRGLISIALQGILGRRLWSMYLATKRRLLGSSRVSGGSGE